ncbi:hypothetical protein ODJ79_44785 [Actinoplanes sp. KI2]|uniref:hypothetical protein n=1 Tax=Actinoplanes sp. KI2 TaxID=2983315 RepID=UPI0021D5B462|nr:hypothetical protein [Actinoplanes sp. KI2]MCU7730875.1 hypothetical protein [Actinoplanes sp. KI2]
MRDERDAVRPVDAARIIAGRIADVLGDRLQAAAVYGSAVTGDLLHGFSDLDLRLFVTNPVTVDDHLALRAALSGSDLGGAAALQLSAAAATPRPCFPPRTFRWVYGGGYGDAVVLDAGQLRAAGADWLARLPGLLADDGLDWAAGTGADGRRQLRLLVTRLKPTVRAIITAASDDPAFVWSAGWPDLTWRLAALDARLGAALDAVLACLAEPGRDDDRAAAMTLRLLDSLVDGHRWR